MATTAHSAAFRVRAARQDLPGGTDGKQKEPDCMAAIEGIGHPGAARPAARRSPPSAGGFLVPTETTVAGPSATGATPATGLASMLTLQELGGETAEDRDARRHGQDMLEALAALQRALLLGGDEDVALQQLAELAAAVPRATDRRLAAMVSAIIVRVRVELARRHL
jgi:hypothetical protein